MILRGEIWWGELREPRGSEPGYRRPLLVVQSNRFNRSRLRTVVTVVLTTSLRLADAPGNVLLPASQTGLPKDSVANVTQLFTIDEAFLDERVGRVPEPLLREVEEGIRLVLDL